MNTIAMKSVLVSFVFFFVAAANIRDLAPDFPSCYRDDPKLNQCLLKATETVRPRLIKGVPELGFVPIEPFVVSEVSLEQQSRLLDFKALLKNVVLKGLSHYKFSQFNFDVPKLRWVAKVTVDDINLNGDYTVNGKVLGAPIEGNGKFTASTESISVTVDCTGKLIKKKGIEHLRHVATNTTITKIVKPKLQLDGLFDGAEQINKATNGAINENIEILFEELRPVVERVIADIFSKGLFTPLANKGTFDELYPKH